MDAYDPEGEREAVERAGRLLRDAAAFIPSDVDRPSFYRNFIENNEPELALGELAYFADTLPAPPQFWRLLAEAAASLKLTEDEPYHGSGVQIVNRHLPN